MRVNLILKFNQLESYYIRFKVYINDNITRGNCIRDNGCNSIGKGLE
jgi:hypothetical protein